MQEKQSKIKYFLYARKSSEGEDRQIQSIDDQVNRLKQLADSLGLDIKKVYTEAKSAKKPNNRPVFDEVVQRIENGEADGILCWQINRLSRNPIDSGKINWLLQQGILKSIQTIDRQYLPEDNVLLLSVESGMANQFVIDLSKNTKRGMQAKLKKGWFPHFAPIGYKNDKYGEQGNKKIFKDEERFDLVRRMWDKMLTSNYSLADIRELANEEWGLRTRKFKIKGGNKLSLSVVHRIFHNSFYYGMIDYGGEVNQGSHEPMVTREEFERVQQILGVKGKTRPKNKKLPFMGVIRCGECGCSITAEEKIKYIKSTGETKSYIYHRCTKKKDNIACKQKPIKHEALKEQIESYLDSLTIPPEFLNWALEVLREKNEVEEVDRNKILEAQQNNYKECVGKIDNLIKIYISSKNSNQELLTEQEFKEQKKVLQEEKGGIESEMKRVGERVNEWMELTEKTFKFATYARHWFEQGDYEAKTGILRTLGSNFVLKDGKLDIGLVKPYLMIKKGLQLEPIKKARLELAESTTKQPVTAVSLNMRNAYSLWGGYRELNPR